MLVLVLVLVLVMVLMPVQNLNLLPLPPSPPSLLRLGAKRSQPPMRRGGCLPREGALFPNVGAAAHRSTGQNGPR